MLNTSSSNITAGNATAGAGVGGNMSGNMSGNSTTMGGNQSSSATSTSQVTIAPGASSPANAKFFDPPTLTVAKGTTVTWKNGDSTIHTVTSGSAEGNETGSLFDSGILAMGKTFQWTFSNAGTFDYYCTLHPQYMKGQVVVK